MFYYVRSGSIIFKSDTKVGITQPYDEIIESDIGSIDVVYEDGRIVKYGNSRIFLTLNKRKISLEEQIKALKEENEALKMKNDQYLLSFAEIAEQQGIIKTDDKKSISSYSPKEIKNDFDRVMLEQKILLKNK